MMRSMAGSVFSITAYVPARPERSRQHPSLPSNSMLWDNLNKKGFVDLGDNFRNTTPESEWKTCLAHAEKIGLGSREYELITMK